MITIPGYELYNRLGGGLLTSVYTARERSTDTHCAVKVLRPDWEDQATAIKLLQREARACFAVRHEHLVSLRYAHVLRPPHFLVMDLLAGESLRAKLRRDYQLTVTEATWIGRQVAEALLAMHSAGYIHGDIKPDNVHLTNEGNAVLLDLGFAHRPGENKAILKKGYILGTVDYLAPELCGSRPIDNIQSDLFSLGATLFEMLAGHLPYPTGSINEIIQRHANEPPADIREQVPGIPSRLANLVMGLMALDPRNRPKTLSVVQQLISMEIATLRRRKAA